MKHEKRLVIKDETPQEAAPMEPVVSFARIVRKSTGWQVMGVDLPASVAAKFEKPASEWDVYPNVEKRLLVEARKTDDAKWK